MKEKLFLTRVLDPMVATDDAVSALCEENFTTFSNATKCQQARVKMLAKAWEVEYEDDAQFCQDLAEEGALICGVFTIKKEWQ